MNPFIGIAVIPETRLFVTFVKEPPKSSLSGKEFKLVGMSGCALFSVIDLSGSSTPDLMKALDKEFQ